MTAVLTLHEHETVQLVVRKHWFVMLPTLILFVVLLATPMILALTPFDLERLIPVLAFENITVVLPFLWALLPFYIMAVLLGLFLSWTDHYLDMWIVTDRRIIDIEQYGLFSREVSEIPLERVQDVTIEIHGVFETFLKFGTIRIQTAGERDFFIHYAPHHERTKELILRNAKQIQSRL